MRSMAAAGGTSGEEAIACAGIGDPDSFWGLVQVLSLMAVYGYVLFMASNMLSSRLPGFMDGFGRACGHGWSGSQPG